MASCVNVKNPFTKYVKKRFDNIEHADNDHKLYRGLVLGNKMKILLISDSKTDMSIAAMDVNIGHNCDTKPLLGLAHLCEHMLFLGTEKYRSQNDFDMYLTQSNGRSNGTTSINSTNYYFTVTPDKLEGALDRFAQFFIAPLFDKNLLEKEINTIDSEYHEKLTNENSLLIRLEKESIKLDHPYSNFDIGNKETLEEIPKDEKIDVRAKLKKFYKKYYSANIMSLCILSTDSLDVLESMVVECFCNVKNRKVKLSTYFEHPIKDEDFNTKWYYVPKRNIKWLCISFTLLKIKPEHRMPLDYITHLFQYESEGSLLSVLKAENWCDNLEIMVDHVDTNTRFFKVLFHLTKTGVNYVDNIVRKMFQYINMLKEDGPQKWIYEEIQKMSEINNSYGENIYGLSDNDIRRIARQLHECPMEKIVLEQRAWQPELIEKLIKEHFTPQKIRIYVAAKEYESVVSKKEVWFDIKYEKTKIPEVTMDMWEGAGRSADLKFPPENEFIPKNFVIKPYVQQKIPQRIMDTLRVRVWHKKDNVFNVPKVTMIFNFVSPFAYVDPRSSNFTDIFVELIRKSLYDYTYRAKLAGITWYINGTQYGIIMTIDGYDEKQRDLLEKSMDQMINVEFDEKWFKNTRHKIKSKNFIDMSEKTDNYLEMLVTEQHWLNDELLHCMKGVKAAEFSAELELFKTKLFSKMHVECLIYGNMTKEEAKGIGQLLEIKLKIKMSHVVPLLQKQLLLSREIKLENGCHVLFEDKNEVLKTSSTIVYYATGLRSTESNMLLLLLHQIINQHTLNTLRTEYNLGYTVFSKVMKRFTTQYLAVGVQGDRRPPDVEVVIDLFMENMYKHISTMSKKKFENYKNGLKSKLTASKTRSKQYTLYWNEINKQEYNFDREAIEVDYLQKIPKQQLLQFFEENIINKSTRRRMSVHVMPTDMAMEMNLSNLSSGKITVTSSTNEIKKFDDLLSFKLSQSLYPLLEPIDENFVRKPHEME